MHVLSTNVSPLEDGPVVRRTRGGVMCPQPVAANENYMSGVDRCMQHRAKNPVGRSSKKCWKFSLTLLWKVAL